MSSDDKSSGEDKSGKTPASTGTATKGAGWREPQTIDAKVVASTVHEPAVANVPPAAGSPPKPAQTTKPGTPAASPNAAPPASGATSAKPASASAESATAANAKAANPAATKATGKPRSSVAFAVLAGAGVALLGSIALHMINDPETEIGTLQNAVRNQAHDFSDFKAQSQTTIAALQKQVAALQAAPVAAASPASPALVRAEPGPASSAPPSVSSNILANLQSRIDKVDQALPPIVADLAAQKTQIAKIASTPNAAALAEIAQSTLRAIDQSRPFPLELKALQELHVPDEQLTPLAKIAEKGAPDARELAKAFAPVMEKITAASAPPPPATHDTMGWLVSKAASLVKVRPVGVQAGHSPTAIASQVEAELQAGHADQALTLWHSLPAATQGLGSDWASGLDARQAAQTAATKILNGAIAAMATPNANAEGAKP
ncbi:MAG: hypothetical protein KGQ46_00240 [Hyphomicrobiales bacterium]|nr:hypothetical protein [Hyphomicrobiales bacterium]MDE2113567.1 hypothetical protein [Hyphomicrobiales bacterium]